MLDSDLVLSPIHPIPPAQENMATLLTYTDGSEKMNEDRQQELNTQSSTVTPWWWGFKTLAKYRCGHKRRSLG